MLDVDRATVMAHRIAAQGLHRDGRLAGVLTLGVQDLGPSVRIALAARDDQPDPAAHGLADGWTHRGAPHHHPRGDVQAVARASRPLDDADAAARLAWSGPEQRRVGIPAREAVDRAADALAAVVTEPMTKGAASTEVTRRLPDALLRDCRPCGCVHVNEQLMRLSALPVGVGLDPSGKTLLLTPPPVGWVRPTEADPRVAARLVDDYLRVLGPATRADVASFVGSSSASFRPAWDAALPDLVEVRVDGTPAWLPADDLAALEHAPDPDPDVVRLLPPSDPYLQARDRTRAIPDEAVRADLFRIIGNPGAVLADGEIVGTWRPKAAGTKLTLVLSTVTPVARAALDDEAERVAAARGLRLAALEVS